MKIRVVRVVWGWEKRCIDMQKIWTNGFSLETLETFLEVWSKTKRYLHTIQRYPKSTEDVTCLNLPMPGIGLDLFVIQWCSTSLILTPHQFFAFEWASQQDLWSTDCQHDLAIYLSGNIGTSNKWCLHSWAGRTISNQPLEKPTQLRCCTTCHILKIWLKKCERRRVEVWTDWKWS